MIMTMELAPTKTNWKPINMKPNAVSCVQDRTGRTTGCGGCFAVAAVHVIAVFWANFSTILSLGDILMRYPRGDVAKKRFVAGKSASALKDVVKLVFVFVKVAVRSQNVYQTFVNVALLLWIYARFVVLVWNSVEKFAPHLIDRHLRHPILFNTVIYI